MTFVVAIDGPAGAGKSSVAQNVARRLSMTRLDTGALYRSVTLIVLREGTEDPVRWAEIARDLDIRFDRSLVYLANEDVTETIRSAEVNQHVSRVAADPGVRRALLQTQRVLARSCSQGALLEGRDIGTVVFPDADLKVFLTASDEERARRRWAELPDGTATIAEVLASIRARDAYDGGREHAPLRPAPDAVHIDSTGLTQAEVERRIVELVEAARSEHVGSEPSRQ
ncbi:MAG: (d)CMP kinase [Myxococcota bacterium]